MKRTVTRVVRKLVSSTVTVEMGAVSLAGVISVFAVSVLVGVVCAFVDTSEGLVDTVVSGRGAKIPPKSEVTCAQIEDRGMARRSRSPILTSSFRSSPIIITDRDRPRICFASRFRDTRSSRFKRGLEGTTRKGNEGYEGFDFMQDAGTCAHGGANAFRCPPFSACHLRSKFHKQMKRIRNDYRSPYLSPYRRLSDVSGAGIPDVGIVMGGRCQRSVRGARKDRMAQSM